MRQCLSYPAILPKIAYRENIDNILAEGVEKVAGIRDKGTLIDSMVLCKFVCVPAIGPILWEQLTRLYSIVTGVEAKMHACQDEK